MSETPDLSKIVSVIMQNPSLISEIAALANGGKESEVTEEKAEVVREEKEVELAPKAQVEPQLTPKARIHRKELLNAMKPYLSESRRASLDSMSSILDIIDVMIRKES